VWLARSKAIRRDVRIKNNPVSIWIWLDARPGRKRRPESTAITTFCSQNFSVVLRSRTAAFLGCLPACGLSESVAPPPGG
jgi:hypothetical protein